MLSPAECRAHFRGAASHGAVAHPPRHRGSSQVDAHAFSTSAPSSTSAADPALGHARRQLESAAAPTKAAYLRYLLTGLARALPPAGRAALLDAVRARNAGRSTDAELAAAVRGLVDRCAPAVSVPVSLVPGLLLGRRWWGRVRRSMRTTPRSSPRPEVIY